MIKLLCNLNSLALPLNRRVKSIKDAGDGGSLRRFSRKRTPNSSNLTLAYFIECRTRTESFNDWREQVKQVVEKLPLDIGGNETCETLISGYWNSCNRFG